MESTYGYLRTFVLWILPGLMSACLFSGTIPFVLPIDNNDEGYRYMILRNTENFDGLLCDRGVEDSASRFFVIGLPVDRNIIFNDTSMIFIQLSSGEDTTAIRTLIDLAADSIENNVRRVEIWVHLSPYQSRKLARSYRVLQIWINGTVGDESADVGIDAFFKYEAILYPFAALQLGW
jgi:hypothetical protein